MLRSYGCITRKQKHLRNSCCTIGQDTQTPKQLHCCAYLSDWWWHYVSQKSLQRRLYLYPQPSTVVTCQLQWRTSIQTYRCTMLPFFLCSYIWAWVQDKLRTWC